MQCAVLYGYKELGNNAAVTGTQLPLRRQMTSDMTSYTICDITSDMTSKKTYEMTTDMASDMTFNRTFFFLGGGVQFHFWLAYFMVFIYSG